MRFTGALKRYSQASCIANNGILNRKKIFLMTFDAKRIQNMSLLLIPTKLLMIVANFDSADRKHVRRSDFTVKNQDSLCFENRKGGLR